MDPIQGKALFILGKIALTLRITGAGRGRVAPDGGARLSFHTSYLMIWSDF